MKSSVKCYYSASREDVFRAISENHLHHYVLLFKGSRSLQMEDIISMLTSLMISTFLISCCLCLFLTNFAINYFRERHIKQYILRDAPKTHLIKEGTPTMGGVAILLSILVVLLTQPIHADPWVLLPFFLLIGYGLIGLIDDLQKVFQKQNKGLSGKHKIFFQIVVASIFVGLLAAANHYSTAPELLKQLGPIGYYLLLVFIIVGTSNAVNLTDGLDGLVAGNLLIAFLGLLLFILRIQLPATDLHRRYIRALFGFLWFNINPPNLYGDTGSLRWGLFLQAFPSSYKELPSLS